MAFISKILRASAIEKHGPRFGLCVLIAWLAAFTIANAKVNEQYIERMSMEVRFALREFFGAEPALDPRLKIFVYDDETVSRLGMRDIDLTDWATLFEALDARSPNVIVADKVFDMMLGHLPDVFLERMAALKTPISSRAVITKEPLKWRRPMSVASPYYGLFDMLVAADSSRKQVAHLNWIPVEGGHPYSADPEIKKAFRRVGFVDAREDGYFQPFYRLSKMRAIPHFGLTAAKRIEFHDGALVLDGTKVPVTNAGRVAINFPSYAEFVKRQASFQDLFVRSQVRIPLSEISPGDTVLILPSMYLGEIDMLETPFGRLPLAYTHASIINSILTGRWLEPVPMHALYFFLAAFAGALAGFFGNRKWFLAGHTLIAALVAAAGLALFIWSDYLAPWNLTAIAYWAGGGLMYLDKRRQEKLERIRIEREVETARFVQESIFPERVNKSASLTVVGEYVPASECSGDWWGHFEATDNREFLLVGDALGHGIPAALVTGMAYACAAALIDEERSRSGVKTSPAMILERLNHVLHSATAGESSMSLVCIEFDFANGVATYANAGHQFPVLIPRNPNDYRIKRKQRTYQKVSPLSPVWLQETGPIIGMDAGSRYKDTTIQIQPGDKLLLYTDGIVESRNLLGESWGVRNLAKRFLVAAALPAEDITPRLVEEANDHCEGRQREDDFTLVVAQVSDDWEPAIGGFRRSS